MCAGPCIGGIIVTFSDWRIIYWLQVAMTGVGLILSLLFIPDIEDPMKAEPDKKRRLTNAISMFNPLRILRQFVYPNMFFAVSP